MDEVALIVDVDETSHLWQQWYEHLDFNKLKFPKHKNIVFDISSGFCDVHSESKKVVNVYIYHGCKRERHNITYTYIYIS